jgi:hypothetical protein
MGHKWALANDRYQATNRAVPIPISKVINFLFRSDHPDLLGPLAFEELQTGS